MIYEYDVSVKDREFMCMIPPGTNETYDYNHKYGCFMS